MILAILMGVTAMLLIVSPWLGGGLYDDPLADVATGLAIATFWAAYFWMGTLSPAMAITCVLLASLGQASALRTEQQRAEDVRVRRDAET